VFSCAPGAGGREHSFPKCSPSPGVSLLPHVNNEF
jgi:hypothetical protein